MRKTVAAKKRAKSTTKKSSDKSKDAARWTFFTNHSHVLIRLNQNPQSTLREVAQSVGITERAVLRIVQELVDDGFLERERVGRRNEYRVLANKPLRHPIEAHCCIGDILKLIESKRPE